MSCKALLNTVLATPTSVNANGTIPIGTAIHGFGSAVNLNGNGIALSGAGYYKVSVDVTASPVAQGDYQIYALIDGTAITGATASAPPVGAGADVTLPLQFVVFIPCNCAGIKTVTVATSSAVTVSNMSVIVEKV